MKKIKILIFSLLIIVGIIIFFLPKSLSKTYSINESKKIFLENYNDKLFILEDKNSNKIEILNEKFKIIAKIEKNKKDFKNIVDISENTIIFNLEDATYSVKSIEEVKEYDFFIEKRIDLNNYEAKDKNGKKGVVDKNLTVKIPFEYDRLVELKEGCIAGVKNNQIDLINLKTNKVLNLLGKAIGFFSDNDLALFIDNDEKKGYINRDGILKIEPEYIQGTPFKFNLAVVKTELETLVIDSENNVLYRTSSNYEIEILDKSKLLITKNNFTNIYDIKSKKQIAVYEWIGGKVEDKLLFLDKGKFGVINLKGDILIKPKYLEIGILNSNTLILKNENNLFELYTEDSTGVKEFPYLLKRADQIVTMDPETGNFGVIDKSGEEIIPKDYVEIKVSGNKVLAERHDTKYDIYYKNIKILNMIDLDTVLSLTNKFIILKNGDEINFYKIEE